MSVCDVCGVLALAWSLHRREKPTKPAIFLFLFAVVSFGKGEEGVGMRVVKEYGAQCLEVTGSIHSSLF